MVLCLCRMSKLTTQPECILNSGFRLQLLATATATLLAFSHGIGLGWLSPTLTKLQSEDSPLPFHVGIEEASWIGSTLGLGSALGCALSGVLLDVVGRKPCLYLIAIPHMCLWVLIYCAQSVEYLYVARFLGGITGGSSYVVIPIFISDIADSRIRGTLSSMLMFNACLGTLVGYIIAKYLSYHLTPLVVFVLPVTYLLCVCYFPETPQHLLRKERYREAESSYCFYRNCGTALKGDAPTHCKQDFEQLRAIIAKSKEEGTQITLQDFITKPALTAFLTAFMMILTNQLSGIFVFINYMSIIFRESSSDMDADVCVMITGVMQILGCYASIVLVDRVGRKALFLISVGGVFVGLTAFGFYTAFGGKEGFWVPLLLMAFIIFIGCMGIINIVFIIIVENIPTKIRSVALSVTMTCLNLMVFLMLRTFPIYMFHFGISITMWTCAAACVFGFLYVAIFLSETKGKSMDAD